MSLQMGLTAMDPGRTGVTQHALSSSRPFSNVQDSGGALWRLDTTYQGPSACTMRDLHA